MREKDYREIQLSSTHLVLIIFGLLVVGCVIFLLGISVGKKQALVESGSDFGKPSITDVSGSQPAEEKVSNPEAKGIIQDELISHQKIQAETEPASPPEKKEKAKPQPNLQEGDYYIQAGAYSQKTGAETHVSKLKAQGFSAIILDPLPRDRRPIFRVRVVGYQSREEAQTALARLAAAENKKVSDYFIAQQQR
jgi:cell division septation protein DedD